MTYCYQVYIDESETPLSRKEILDRGLNALSEEFAKMDCFFDVGYNPEQVAIGLRN